MTVCYVAAAALARSWAKRSAISSAVRTASAPLSTRASACSTVSVVSTPNATGMPVSIAASWSPEAASPATKSKCGGLAADDAAERDDAREAAGLRERERGERQLERPGHGHDGHGLARDTRPVELLEGRREQAGRDLAVELRRRARRRRGARRPASPRAPARRRAARARPRRALPADGAAGSRPARVIPRPPRSAGPGGAAGGRASRASRRGSARSPGSARPRSAPARSP